MKELIGLSRRGKYFDYIFELIICIEGTKQQQKDYIKKKREKYARELDNNKIYRLNNWIWSKLFSHSLHLTIINLLISCILIFPIVIIVYTDFKNSKLIKKHCRKIQKLEEKINTPKDISSETKLINEYLSNLEKSLKEDHNHDIGKELLYNEGYQKLKNKFNELIELLKNKNESLNTTTEAEQLKNEIAAINLEKQKVWSSLKDTLIKFTKDESQYFIPIAIKEIQKIKNEEFKTLLDKNLINSKNYMSSKIFNFSKTNFNYKLSSLHNKKAKVPLSFKKSFK